MFSRWVRKTSDFRTVGLHRAGRWRSIGASGFWGWGYGVVSVLSLLPLSSSVTPPSGPGGSHLTASVRK